MLKIRVPASSANLGPGFDSMALALDIWNDVSFAPAERLTYRVRGEGAEKFNKGGRNLLNKAFARLFELCGRTLQPTAIESINRIPISSGLGSSAAAVLTGLYGANALLGEPLNRIELLRHAAEMEGHADNAAAVLLGGLVIASSARDAILTRRYDLPQLCIVIVTPAFSWPTRAARAVLPHSISRVDAVHNIGRALLVLDALQRGDLELLQASMDDRMHQPYRLRHITGGVAAFKAAKRFGAAALSGAGPSIIAFIPVENAAAAAGEVQSAFRERGVESRAFITRPSNRGIHRIE